MSLTLYLALFLLAMLALAVWAIVRLLRRKRRGVALMVAAGYLGLVAAVYFALGALIGRM